MDIQRVWNYLLDPEAVNADHDTPVWSLGREYSPLPDPVVRAQQSDVQKQISATTASAKALLSNYFKPTSNSSPETSSRPAESAKPVTTWPASFVDAVEEKMYLTYRTDFPMIPRASNGPGPISVGSLLRGHVNDRAGFTSDVGWGCMIRTGQTLLANTLSILHQAEPNSELEKKILSWFADDPQAQFSVHNFVYHGRTFGKYPGEWFGPSATARCIQNLCLDFKPGDLRVYIGGDSGDVYEESVMRISGGPQHFQPTLILLGIRLGIEKITPVYHDALRFALRLPQSVGIAGGRPMSSHYFYACQGQFFFYLDPHIHRKALPYRSNLSEYSEEEIASVHTRRVRNIRIDDMDPSMLIGFLIKDLNDWEDWKKQITQFKGRQFVHISNAEPSFAKPNPDDRRPQTPSIAGSSNDIEDFEHIGLEEGKEYEDFADGVVALEESDAEEHVPVHEDDIDDQDFDRCVT